MLKVSVTYHLKSGLRDNGDGQTTCSLVLTGITYGLSLRNQRRSLLNFKITDSKRLLSKVLQRIGLTTTKRLLEY